MRMGEEKTDRHQDSNTAGGGVKAERTAAGKQVWSRLTGQIRRFAGRWILNPIPFAAKDSVETDAAR